MDSYFEGVDEKTPSREMWQSLHNKQNSTKRELTDGKCSYEVAPPSGLLSGTMYTWTTTMSFFIGCVVSGDSAG